MFSLLFESDDAKYYICMFFNRKTGAISREIRDMEAQIKHEESRDLKSKIGNG